MIRKPVRISGGCHCGAVRFNASIHAPADIHRCNCSVCSKSGFLHLIVANDDFNIECGADELTSYRFNTRTAQHLFCRHCGIKPFYRPRSHPDGYSINFNCLDKPVRFEHSVVDFDGENWRKNVEKIGR